MYYNYFSNERYFCLPTSLGRMVGKPVLFSLANSWTKFYQVDKLRCQDGAAKEFWFSFPPLLTFLSVAE
jgi:hypothetical protein